MTSINYEDLKRHIGHKIECVSYGNQNVAIECVDCYEVLLDYDNIIFRKCGLKGYCNATIPCFYECDKYIQKDNKGDVI